MPEYVRNIVSTVWGIVLWACFYVSGYYVFPRWSRTAAAWRSLDAKRKYQLASCIHSTAHGLIVPIGIMVCVTSCDIWGDFEAKECGKIETVFSWTVAYFLFDFVLVLYYRAELWQVFAVHHIVGIAPFLINCFVSSNLHFVVGLGICVELANPFLNIQTALDVLDMHNTETAKKAMYTTLVVWLFVRTALPIYLLYGLIAISIPSYGTSPWGVVFSYVTGFAIGIFCICVLLFVHIPGALYYYRGRHREATKDLEAPTVELTPSSEMDDDVDDNGKNTTTRPSTSSTITKSGSKSLTDRVKDMHTLRRRLSSLHTC